MDRKFEREVDPDNKLAPEERAKRIESARRAYFTGLSLKASQARRRRAGESLTDVLVPHDGPLLPSPTAHDVLDMED